MRICIFGASADNLDKIYYDEAFELGRLIAEGGHTLVYGGGQTGLMGACADGVMSAGGELIGIAPRFFDEPGVLFDGCTEFIFTDTMNERKALMLERSDAFITLPGGIGTFEEFFEMLTLKQLGRHNKPMAILNTASYYDSLEALLEKAVDCGFLGRSCMDIFALSSSPAAAVEYAEKSAQKEYENRSFRSYGN